MKNLKLAAVILIFAALLGCTSQAPATVGGTSAGANFDLYQNFGTFSNNSTSATAYPYAMLKNHAFVTTFYGNWSIFEANISYQGSIDQTTWYELTSIETNESTISIAIDKPVRYVRAVITKWNATDTNATIANLTIKYAGST